jgi:hypothetical protein
MVKSISNQLKAKTPPWLDNGTSPGTHGKGNRETITHQISSRFPSGLLGKIENWMPFCRNLWSEIAQSFL